MAVKVAIVAVILILVSVYAENILLDTDANYAVKRTLKEWSASGCSRREDKICETKDESWCKYSRFRLQCPRKCGECGAFPVLCPSNFILGCCWDGSKSLTLDKSDCRDCVENPKICGRYAVRRDCSYQTNTPETRRLCPITCGACHDYGN